MSGDEVAENEPVEVRVLLEMIQTRREAAEHLLDIAQRFPSSRKTAGDARHTAEMLTRLFTEIEVLDVAVFQLRVAQASGDAGRARYA